MLKKLLVTLWVLSILFLLADAVARVLRIAHGDGVAGNLCSAGVDLLIVAWGTHGVVWSRADDDVDVIVIVDDEDDHEDLIDDEKS
jgi:hypothetical protein